MCCVLKNDFSLYNHNMNGYNIIHSHDGAADDQMALLLLVAQYKLSAVVLTPADSHAEPAEEMCKKILTATNNWSVPLIVNNAHIPNPFPIEWRDESTAINKLIDVVIDTRITTKHMSDLITIIEKSELPIIYIETGTLTTLATCLSINPSIESKIKKIIWTGGSFDRPMLNPPHGCDGTQTYNSYSDPFSANLVFSTNIEIMLFTREVTEKAHLTREFYDNLPKSPYGEIYKSVYSFYINMPSYRLWDVLTVAFINIPKAFNTTHHNCKLITDGASAGKTEICDDGRIVEAVYDVNLELFYANVIDTLR